MFIRTCDSLTSYTLSCSCRFASLQHFVARLTDLPESGSPDRDPRSTSTTFMCLSQEFVAGLTDLPEGARAALAALTPAGYIGNAAEQARGLPRQLRQLAAAHR